MYKKLFIVAVIATSVTVPLAGSAWADPPSGNNPPGHGTTGPGLPNETGNLFGSPDHIPPGSVYSDLAQQEGTSTPEATRDFLNNDYYGGTTNFGEVPPGEATKTFTPGCTSGNTASDPAVDGGNAICH